MKYVILLSFLITQNILAADLYPFKSHQKQTQFNDLILQLRCLVCQNENLSASNAKIGGIIILLITRRREHKEIQ